MCKLEPYISIRLCDFLRQHSKHNKAKRGLLHLCEADLFSLIILPSIDRPSTGTCLERGKNHHQLSTAIILS